MSERLAETVARHMLVDERPARSIQSLRGHLSATDALVTRFEDEVRARMGEVIHIPEIADALDVTRRTLERHVRQGTGRTPGQLIQRLRARQAQHLRRTTELSMDQVAHRVGHASAITLAAGLRPSRLTW